ncbi:ATP-binding cassette domain-containing protein [uncultured Demequina sp.]|uniref:ATP-binding cassette domain-containing protein n=1 Tax=uncultured Demequina sp. TaxID=693499 RepID=UPI0026004904|nr:ATP-binding cassette domain-containing protein [uncultured Demequina sp.]
MTGTTDLKLEVTDVTKSFGNVTALRGATLSARAGEVTAIIGDNGAGKSTLIKCVSGYHAPDGGEIKVSGKPVHFGSPLDARHHGIETVYQDLALADQLSVWQNIYLNRELTAGPWPFRVTRRGAMRAKARELVGDLAVNVPEVTKTVMRLSGGQRQAVAISRAVMWSNEFVIMDEPTAALGLRETQQVEALIRRIVERGTSVLIISHNFEQVMRLSDQVWVMRGGRVVNGHRTAEVTGADLVAEVTGAAAEHF